jgi:hypothetical protein
MGHSRQLITCPACESALIQIGRRYPTGDAGVLLERHCPECGLDDILTVAAVVADVLDEHAVELATSIEELADQLEAASELWISR